MFTNVTLCLGAGLLPRGSGLPAVPALCAPRGGGAGIGRVCHAGHSGALCMGARIQTATHLSHGKRRSSCSRCRQLGHQYCMTTNTHTINTHSHTHPHAHTHTHAHAHSHVTCTHTHIHHHIYMRTHILASPHPHTNSLVTVIAS